MGGAFGKNDETVTADYFKDKVVWITGASGGLGEALSIALCSNAAPRGLILSARSADKLERVAAMCKKLRPESKVEVMVLDLADVDSLPSSAKEGIEAFGQIDVLVNNGGCGFRGIAEETPIDVDRLLMNVDYFSGVALTKALLPSWVKRGQGHVIQISSVQGFFGLPGRTAYAAAKHAAIGFYDSLRAEVDAKGVKVTVVAPGYIATNHSKNAATAGANRYPDGHTSKAVSPEVMAPQVLAAAARGKAEFVPAAFDAKIAIILRILLPNALFKIMRRRAAKEEPQYRGLQEGGADKRD